MFFLLRIRGAENIEKRWKNTKERHWKMKRKLPEKYRKNKITTISIFGFTFYIKIIFYLKT